VAVALSRHRPSQGVAWVRELREQGLLVRYPPEAEPALLRELLGEALPNAATPSEHVASPEVPDWEADLHWLYRVQLLVLPEVTPEVLPACEQAAAAGIPLAAVRSPAAERWLGGGYYPIESPRDAGRVLGFLAADPSTREALLRQAAARARRFRRLLGEAVQTAGRRPEPTAVTPLMPDEILAAGGLPPLPVQGISVIIPTQGGSRVGRCVQALREAAGDVPLQVILVVTGGLTGSLPPCDEVVRCEPPFVWAAANNAGLRVARHPLVLFLNDDCFFLRAGDLARLEARLRQCGHLIAVAPRGEGFPAHWDQYRFPAGGGLRATRHTVTGACFLVRREAFATVGLFDERFNQYGCDEIDWFYRARACGYRWAIDTDVAVDHQGRATYGPDIEDRLRPSIALFRELHGVTPNDGPHWEPPRTAASFVFASRNGAGHLARSLGSIAAHRERYPESLEIVLALDGSTDHSEVVAREFNASLPEPLSLRVYRFPEAAATVSMAKNRALRLATGDVHLPMDDDDAVAAPRADLLPLLEQSGADVAVGDFLVLGVDGSVHHRTPAPISYERLLAPASMNWGLWATAIRRETWERYGMKRDDLPCTGDLELWLRWLRDGVRFAHGDLTVHVNLARRGSITHTYPYREMHVALQEAFRRGRGTPRLGLAADEPEGTVPAKLPEPEHV
jgi:glycosyltransferase involved in cell wall biosynthesis